MKKVSLLFALLFALAVSSCDSTSGDSAAMTDNQKAAAALKLMSDGLQNATANAVTTKADIALPALDLSKLSGKVYETEGMVINAEPVLDPGAFSLLAGVKLTLTMTDYALKMTDPATGKVTDLGKVSGVLEVVLGFDVITSKIVVIANTPGENQLVFTGGQIGSTKIGFTDVKISIDASSITGGISLGGSPVAVAGTIIVNDVPVYVDSEILELLMGMI